MAVFLKPEVEPDLETDSDEHIFIGPNRNCCLVPGAVPDRLPE